MPIFELDPVDEIAVAAVGQPGQRRFFLLASGSGRTLTLTCEKSQIQALLLRLHQMMEAQGIEAPERQPANPALMPGEPEWQVGEMGLGYHEARRMFVLVASQGAAQGGEPGAGSARPGSLRGDVPPQQGGEPGAGSARPGSLWGDVPPQEDEAPDDNAQSVRFWLSHQQVVAFSKQAETVLTAGRPLCPRCGLPMDPAGHPCPVSNGARPIF